MKKFRTVLVMVLALMMVNGFSLACEGPSCPELPEGTPPDLEMEEIYGAVGGNQLVEQDSWGGYNQGENLVWNRDEQCIEMTGYTNGPGMELSRDATAQGITSFSKTWDDGDKEVGSLTAGTAKLHQAGEQTKAELVVNADYDAYAKSNVSDENGVRHVSADGYSADDVRMQLKMAGPEVGGSYVGDRYTFLKNKTETPHGSSSIVLGSASHVEMEAGDMPAPPSGTE